MKTSTPFSGIIGSGTLKLTVFVNEHYSGQDRSILPTTCLAFSSSKKNMEVIFERDIFMLPVTTALQIWKLCKMSGLCETYFTWSTGSERGQMGHGSVTNVGASVPHNTTNYL